MTVGSGNYPAELESTVATRDGLLAHVRPVRPEDYDRLLDFLRGLPAEDRRLRFFSLGNDLSRAARDEANVDYVHSLGLLVTVGPDERIVGHALCAPCSDGRAEVAFAVAHDYQGRRVADVLLRIAALADDHPAVAEVDCNPVVVSTSGAVVVEARVRVKEVAPQRPLGARR